MIFKDNNNGWWILNDDPDDERLSRCRITIRMSESSPIRILDDNPDLGTVSSSFMIVVIVLRTHMTL